MLKWVDSDFGELGLLLTKYALALIGSKRTCLLLDAYIHQGMVFEGYVEVGD